jgi:hypothetical protein
MVSGNLTAGQSPIVFGTSGWRAVIADQFTFDHVELVARAIAEYPDTQAGGDGPVIVGYDTRFLADRFAARAADALAASGRRVLLADRDVPTPVVARMRGARSIELTLWSGKSRQEPIPIFTAGGIDRAARCFHDDLDPRSSGEPRMGSKSRWVRCVHSPRNASLGGVTFAAIRG